MTEFLRECWDLLVYVVGTSPAGLWPLFLALLGSALFTQHVKFYIPSQWPPKMRSLAAQGVAFMTALGIVLALWPTPNGLAAGFCIGLASPTVYAVAVRLIGLKWPQIRDLLSQDPDARQ
jgi:hypothetical protein